MSRIYFLIVCLGLMTPLFSQQKEKVSSDALSAKILFIDYGTANGLDGLKVTNGLEIGYIHNFNHFFGFAIPVKVGVANVFEDPNNRNIVSIDGLLRLQYQKQENSVLIPYLLGGAGLVYEKSADENLQFPLGIGVNIRLGRNSYGNIQGEYRISQAENRNNLQLGLGFIYQFGKADKDRDGIVDDEDDCPDIAGVASANGCPDADNDGIADMKDRCPQDPGPEALKGCPDTDGDGLVDIDDDCPAEPGTINGCPDRDGDGIADKDDACPDEAGLAQFDGCPDTDGDGIIDGEDDCPDQPGPVETQGCPDRDGDGVIDSEDRCPDQPGPAETRGCPDTDGDGLVDPDDLCPEIAGPVDNRGCPEITEEHQEVLDLAMSSVQFETGKATLLDASFRILDQVVDILGQYPAYSMSVNGHTDSVGNEASNQVLSEERANACYDYLISKGISPQRLSHQGFGESNPIADNSSSLGRKMNRRVEFHMYIPE